jgi:hypothetical protein
MPSEELWSTVLSVTATFWTMVVEFRSLVWYYRRRPICMRDGVGDRDALRQDRVRRYAFLS